MSDPATVMGLAKFAVGFLAAKNAVDGISEGNMAKAIVSGVGAYAAFSGIGSLGTEGAKQMTAEAAGQSVTEASTNAALGTESAVGNATISGGVTDGLVSATGTGASDLGFSAMETGEMGTANLGTVATEEAGGGFLDKIGGWVEKNPKMASGLLQMGGGMLQGHAEEELLKEKWARDERLDAESRARRGYTAPTGILGKMKFNPALGQWEAANANS